MKKIRGLICFFITVAVCFVSFYIFSKVNSNLFKNLISKVIPVKIDYQTKTSITGIRDEIKYVTAKQYLDFINIMDGKDGNYVQISTYEIKAGIDFSEGEDAKIKVFPDETTQSHVVSVRNKITDAQKNINYTKPVEIAYKQKAMEYAIQNGILEKAKEQAEKTMERITAEESSFDINDNICDVELPCLPLRFQVSENYFKKNFEIEANNVESGFNRDSLILKSTIPNAIWKIRIGDTGITYKKTDFYDNVLETNIRENENPKDQVELYRYFSPMYPDETTCLSYASDYYRTFFVKVGGRIYYIDCFSEYENQLDDDTIRDQISPLMIYLAASVRKSEVTKENVNEYLNYIDHFKETVDSIRYGENKYKYENHLNNLLTNNKIENEENRAKEEKLLISLNDIKQKKENPEEAEDKYFDSLSKTFTELNFNKNYDTEAKREQFINDITAIENEIQKSRYITKDSNNPNKTLLQSYGFAWMLQNFDLSETEEENFEKALLSNNTLIYRPALISMSDDERNKYFYELFSTRLFYSRRFFDTALKPQDILPEESGQNNKYVFLGFESSDRPDTNVIYSNIVAMNNGKDISDKFIIVYKQTETEFVKGFELADVHAFVLDDATLRFFPSVGAATNLEKGLNWLATFFNDNYPPYFYYGDYSKLVIGKNALTINGRPLGTFKLTKRGKQQYRKTNDFSDLSELLNILCDIQRAYYQEDKDYYYKSMISTLEEEINNYVYDCAFRPSPRLILDTQTDVQKRYNN